VFLIEYARRLVVRRWFGERAFSQKDIPGARTALIEELHEYYFTGQEGAHPDLTLGHEWSRAFLTGGA
jgi:hypothetical protein